FVDDDEAQSPQEAGPLAGPAEQGQVEHVRVRHDPPRVLADPPAGGGPGVAGGGGGGHVGQFRDRGGQGDHGGKLVLPQGLCRGQVEHAGVAVGGERTQGGQLVAVRFLGGGAGGHHDVPAGVRVLGGGGLVLPGALEAALTQDVHQARV